MKFPSVRGGRHCLPTGPTIAAIAALAMPAPAARAADAVPVFSFQDYLGRDWKNEAVRVKLPAGQQKHIDAKSALLGPDMKPVPFQTAPAAPGEPASIEFEANVPPDAKSVYRFSDAAGSGAATPATDLKLEETADTIRIYNGLVGVSLRKKLEPGQGPIEAIRLNSGNWVGGSRLDPKLAPTGYTAKIIDQGPVADEVECRTEFDGGASWVLDFRLTATEPVVDVSETMALGDKTGLFSLSLNDNFNPDQIFFRSGDQTSYNGKPVSIGQNLTAPIKQNANNFVLEPWLRWWIQVNQGPVFSLYNDTSPDMLSIGAEFAGDWVDPKMDAAKRAAPHANLMQDAAGLHLDFALRNGERKWMIGAFDRDAALAVTKDPKLAQATSIPHQYVIKHGEFPLDNVKDYILDWPNEKDLYPHLLMTRAQVAQYKKTHAPKTPLTDDEVKRLTSVKELSQWSMETPISAYFATGDPRLAKYLIDQSEIMMRESLDQFFVQPEVPYGSAPHHQQELGVTPLLTDVILSSDQLTPELRKKILAQTAFLCYAIDTPNYWDPDRGYAANPNMTTSVLGYRIALGSSIASHPLAHQWVTDALKPMQDQLDNWSDADGGWLEAPHYAMVSYDQILGSALIARNAGLSDMVFDPKMKAVINWFSKWSTPPDSRFAGYRHLPPVGNTYISEPSGEFGIVASIYKEKDPEFASEMQWMYHQQHSWPQPGIGGGYPAMAGFRGTMIDETIPEKAPHWGSELFPNTGVVLRNAYPSAHETYMLLLAGSFGGWRSHYDDDSGSVTIWGKGRIVADDFGYKPGGTDEHNLPTSPDVTKSGHFDVSTFAPSKDFDYVIGARGDWQRQIALVKNDDPLAPNFFVMADTFKTRAPATWRIYFTAKSVTPNATGAEIVGNDDVDTDVYMVDAGSLALRTETKSITAGSGIRPDGSNGPTTTTQTALVATAPAAGSMNYVIYPRLKTEKPPVFTSALGGKVIKVETDSETDYIFLGTAPFTWQQGSISFSGTSGAVRLRGKQVVLSLGAGGTVAAQGQTLTSKTADRKEFTP